VSTAGASRLMGNYRVPPVLFVRGEGSRLFDAAGKGYLDFISGLAVTSLGHAHPAVADAVSRQARTLLHVSNLYGNTLGPELAATLDRLLGGGGRVLLCNSGAEANECAIKLARKWAGPGRYAVVSAERSFHGRTLAALAATGQLDKHAGFEPLPAGFRHVTLGDVEGLDRATATPEVAAVLLEPLQGEGGVNEVPQAFLRAARRLCDERGLLLMLDEVQTGLGRTGRWFGFEHFGVRPDVVTLSKALGNGMPIGACWAREEVADAFKPGDHGTTFGGQPLAASAAIAVLEVMEAEDVAGRAERAGKRLRAGLEGLGGVGSVRGLGLLLAAELSSLPAAEATADLLTRGLLVQAVTPSALRLAPSLLVSDDELGEALAILTEVVA
jgi:acetylornithine/N-succinyldiaminopimelate aminotransferase